MANLQRIAVEDLAQLRGLGKVFVHEREELPSNVGRNVLAKRRVKQRDPQRTALYRLSR